MKNKSHKKGSLWCGNKKLIKNAIVCWCMLSLFSIILMAFELIGIHRLMRLNALPFWDVLVSPFANEVKANFFNLFISQISTTFLVTAFLSFLGDKDASVYWTTTMDYKLVHPKGSGLKDFTSYSFATLLISFLAMVLQLKLCFLFSFLLNIIFLIIITYRMIIAFYNRDGIKKELRSLFRKESEAQQQKYLSTMEENMIRAANDHNVEYLRECKEFLEEFITDDDVKSLQSDEKQVKALIMALDDIFKRCNAYLKSETKTIDEGNALGVAASEEGKKVVLQLKEKMIAMYDNIQKTLPALGDSFWSFPEFAPSSDFDAVLKQIKRIADRADRIAVSSENPLWIRLVIERTDRINDKAVHTNMLRYLHIFPQQFVELQFSGIKAICRGIGLEELVEGDEQQRRESKEAHMKQIIASDRMTYIQHFPLAFLVREHVIKLLQENVQTLSDYVCSWGLDMLIATNLSHIEDYFIQEGKWYLDDEGELLDFNGFFSDFIVLFAEAYENHRSLDPYIKAILSLSSLIESGICHIYNEKLSKKGEKPVAYLPDKIEKKVNFFTREEAEILFATACSKKALSSGDCNLYDFLINICKYTRDTDADFNEKITKIIKETTQLGVDKEFILTYLDD